MAKKHFSQYASAITKMYNISKTSTPISTNEVLNESLWYQLPIYFKKLRNQFDIPRDNQYFVKI